MKEITAFQALLEKEYPASKTELVTFPSGAYMFYFHASGEEYVLEYLPSLKGYGISKVSNATFGWEGVENDFQRLEHAMEFALELLERT